jgi:hypothetical protein
MKLKVGISKTIQEKQYEPITASVELEREMPDNTSLDDVCKAFQKVAKRLEDEVFAFLEGADDVIPF